MGILRDPYPPFMKAIMGITTSPICLLVYHSPNLQCSMVTPAGMVYLALKVSLPSSVSTKLENLPILKKKKKVKREMTSPFESLGSWAPRQPF